MSKWRHERSSRLIRNLSNCEREAWKKLMMDPLKLTCSQQLWLHSSVGRALHRCRRGHGFESRWSLNFFQASLWQLLKLCINREDLSWRHLHQLWMLVRSFWQRCLHIAWWWVSACRLATEVASMFDQKKLMVHHFVCVGTTNRNSTIARKMVSKTVVNCGSEFWNLMTDEWWWWWSPVIAIGLQIIRVELF